MHFLLIVLLACGSRAPDPPAAPDAPPAAPAAATELEPGSCSTDDECAWNDPCVPDACVRAGAPLPDVICEESLHPVGTCTCVQGACAQTFPTISCETWRDCDVAHEPKRHPIRANPPRTKEVEPCKDAEVDAVCDEASKTCKLVAWRC